MKFLTDPVGNKVATLIKGYLIYKRKKMRLKGAFKKILALSIMSPTCKYKINEKGEEILEDLEKLRLLKRVSQHYFVISPFFYNFAFEHKP